MDQIETTAVDYWTPKWDNRPTLLCSNEVFRYIEENRPEYHSVAKILKWGDCTTVDFYGADGVLLGTEALDAKSFCESWKVISRIGTGYDNIDLPKETVLNKCVFAVNTTGYAVANYVMDVIKERRPKWWKSCGDFLPTHLDKKIKAGVIGLGNVGAKVYNRFVEETKGSSSDTIYANDPIKSISDMRNGIGCDTQKSIFENCNIVSVHIPSTKANEGWLDGGKMDVLPDNALVIAPVRTAVIDFESIKSWANLLRKKGITIVVDCEVPVREGYAEAFGGLVYSTHHTATRVNGRFGRMLDEAFNNALRRIENPNSTDGKLKRVF